MNFAWCDIIVIAIKEKLFVNELSAAVNIKHAFRTHDNTLLPCHVHTRTCFLRKALIVYLCIWIFKCHSVIISLLPF